MSPLRILRRRERGGAIVELALGSLVFVTILTLGIYFGELSFLSLKPVEAANFAAFDATGRPMHDMASGNWDRYQTAATGAANQAQREYDDLDATRDLRGAHREVFTRVVPSRGGSLLNMDCKTGGAGRVSGVNPHWDANIERGIRSPFNGETGMRCSADIRVATLNLPTQFYESQFHHREFNAGTITACAMGVHYGGSCDGQVGILLDDWGLAGDAESTQCTLSQEQGGGACANKGYYDVGNAIYHGPNIQGAFAGSAGVDLVATVHGTPGMTNGDETHYWLSFVGYDSPTGKPFMERLPGGSHENFPEWQTTAYFEGINPTSYSDAYLTKRVNRKCFLGLSCR